MQHHPNTTALSFKLEVHPRVPEKEIVEVLQFLGSQMVAGRVDIRPFDEIANTFIGISPGDFCVELSEIKRKWKRILAQCDAREVAGR